MEEKKCERILNIRRGDILKIVDYDELIKTPYYVDPMGCMAGMSLSVNEIYPGSEIVKFKGSIWNFHISAISFEDDDNFQLDLSEKDINDLLLL